MRTLKKASLTPANLSVDELNHLKDLLISDFKRSGAREHEPERAGHTASGERSDGQAAERYALGLLRLAHVSDETLNTLFTQDFIEQYDESALKLAQATCRTGYALLEQAPAGIVGMALKIIPWEGNVLAAPLLQFSSQVIRGAQLFSQLKPEFITEADQNLMRVYANLFFHEDDQIAKGLECMSTVEIFARLGFFLEALKPTEERPIDSLARWLWFEGDAAFIQKLVDAQMVENAGRIINAAISSNKLSKILEMVSEIKAAARAHLSPEFKALNEALGLGGCRFNPAHVPDASCHHLLKELARVLLTSLIHDDPEFLNEYAQHSTQTELSSLAPDVDALTTTCAYAQSHKYQFDWAQYKSGMLNLLVYYKIDPRDLLPRHPDFMQAASRFLASGCKKPERQFVEDVLDDHDQPFSEAGDLASEALAAQKAFKQARAAQNEISQVALAETINQASAALLIGQADYAAPSEPINVDVRAITLWLVNLQESPYPLDKCLPFEGKPSGARKKKIESLRKAVEQASESKGTELFHYARALYVEYLKNPAAELLPGKPDETKRFRKAFAEFPETPRYRESGIFPESFSLAEAFAWPCAADLNAVVECIGSLDPEDREALFANPPSMATGHQEFDKRSGGVVYNFKGRRALCNAKHCEAIRTTSHYNRTQQLQSLLLLAKVCHQLDRALGDHHDLSCLTQSGQKRQAQQRIMEIRTQHLSHEIQALTNQADPCNLEAQQKLQTLQLEQQQALAVLEAGKAIETAAKQAALKQAAAMQVSKLEEAPGPSQAKVAARDEPAGLRVLLRTVLLLALGLLPMLAGLVLHQITPLNILLSVIVLLGVGAILWSISSYSYANLDIHHHAQNHPTSRSFSQLDAMRAQVGHDAGLPVVLPDVSQGRGAKA